MSGASAAFPFQLVGSQGHPIHEGETGLTKRELIAAMAMQGLLAGEYRCAGPSQLPIVSGHAVAHADALLAELAKDGSA